MRITGSDLTFEAAASRVEFTSERAELRVFTVASPAPERAAGGAREERDGAEISDAARRLRAADGASASDCTCRRRHGEEALDAVSGDVRLTVTKLLIERLTGHSFDVLDPHEMSHRRHHRGVDGAEGPRVESAGRGSPDERRAPQVRVEFDYERVHYESEQARFQARGTVTTSDGRQISLEVDVSMSREYLERQEVHIRAGAARTKDPLALSLSGGPVTLTPGKIAFDLDADGTPENVSFVGTGAAFLARDLNGNGAVDDDGELFGPCRGDGFDELAELDADGNGWIDEGDPAFSDLRLWQRTADGEDIVRALADAGVAAISLARVATPFTHADEREIHGVTRTSGLFLAENGGAGVAQQVDLAV